MPKPRTFIVEVGPHPPQLAIQAFDLTEEEYTLLTSEVQDCYIESESYKLRTAAGAFLQGSDPPHQGKNDGFVLIEFWCSRPNPI